MRLASFCRLLPGLLPAFAASAQTKLVAPVPAALGPLTVDKIMREPAQWLGNSPANVYWSEDGRRIYFSWNPEKARRDSLYFATPDGKMLRKLSLREQQALPAATGRYDLARRRKVYEKDGDIFLLDLKTQQARRVTNTAERESSPAFALLGQLVSYTRAGNLYTWSPASGETVQRTDFRRGNRPPSTEPSDRAEKTLRAQQLALFEVIRQRRQDQQAQAQRQKALARLRPKAIWLGTQTVDNLQLSPDGRHVTYQLIQEASGAKTALVPNFVTASGFPRTSAPAPKSAPPSRPFSSVFTTWGATLRSCWATRS